MKILAVLFALILITSNAISQTGTVSGKVLDYESGEGLIGALIINNARTKYTRVMELEGSFTLKLPAGEHYLISEYPGYIKDSVKVIVTNNKTTEVTIRLAQKILGSGIIVKGKIDKKGETANLTNEKKSEKVITNIGKEAMDKADASTVDQAVAKTAGASVEGGKYVYIRGLSDRYSKTTINGAEVPGLDPNRNSVQMDLFPTSLLDRISVYKSFTPDLPASFTGGLVDLQTRDFPDDYILTASVKFGFNTQSSLNDDFLSQKTSGSTDFLGFDNGNRGIPVQLRRYGTQTLNEMLFQDPEKLNELGKSFNKDFEPVRKMSGINQSYAFTVGNQIDSLRDGKDMYPKIGYVTGISYRNNYSYYDKGRQGRYNLVGSYDTDETLNAELDLVDSKGEHEVLWAALGNLSVKTNKNNIFGVTVARFQNGITSTRYLEGNNYSDANDLYFQTRTLYYQQRALNLMQLKGEHVFTKKDSIGKTEKETLIFDWNGSYTLSRMETPELKFFTNDYTIDTTSVEPDTTFDLQPQLYSDPSRFYRYMNESNIDVKLNFTRPFQTFIDPKTKKGLEGKFKFGTSVVLKDRVFKENRYDFAQQSGNTFGYNGDVSDYMADENFDAPDYTNGFLYLQDATEKRNSYSGYESIYGAYFMTDAYVQKTLRLVGGIRAEYDDISSVSKSPALRDSVGGYTKLDILPSLNGTYLINGDTLQLRFAYNRTVARPTFRELAPFSSFDFVGGNVYVGNPGLKRTLIDNIDLRLENYPTPSQKLTIGAFAKFFTYPIERAFNPEASNAELTWRNVDKARAYGVELDYVIKLDSMPGILRYMTVGGNITLVRSEVTIPEKEYDVLIVQRPNASRTRKMFGQAPYIINGQLGYENDSAGWAVNINFGISGKKLSVVTVGGTPNVFENARPILGFNVSKQFGKYDQFSFKFSALNLLNPIYKQFYEYNNEEYIFGAYTRGRTFNLGLKYTVDRADRKSIDRELKDI